MDYRKFYTCCFIGHRKIERTKELEKKLYCLIEGLIKLHYVDTFLFGSKSEFDDMCLEIVSKLKKKYGHIKRVYVRAEYQHISAAYTEYLLRSYDETYFPSCAINAGRSVYVKRNLHMIDQSHYCMFYYIKDDTAKKSGTNIAYEYSEKKNKASFNISELQIFI